MVSEENEILNEWDVVWGELSQLKKEMVRNIVEEYNRTKWGLLSNIFKDNIVDYLVDEWDTFDNVLLELWIWLFSNSAAELKELKWKVIETNDKTQLSSLESEILGNLRSDWVFFKQDITPSTDTSDNVGQNQGISSHSVGERDAVEEVDYNTSHLESARLWQAKEIPLSKRKEWLFPNWVPKTKNEMLKYVTRIKVPITTADWQYKELTLSVHKKLANEYEDIFKTMKEQWIPVNPKSTACFNWRKMRKWKSMSHHSYGTAIDVNWDVNGWVYGKTDSKSPYYNDQAMVNIRKNHGFYWWWDWSKKNDDPMHFTYMNG